MSKVNQSMAAVEARLSLRENIKRLARVRRAAAVIPLYLVWPERQLLFSLVHGLVCATADYDPMLDGQVAWAAWFLRRCESERDAGQFTHEEAALLLILGLDGLCDDDEDHDSADDLTYALG